MSKTNTIPDFNNTPDSMGTSLRAMKGILERVTGQNQGQALGAPNMFVQLSQPAASQTIILRKGDLWINDSTHKMSYWNGKAWKALVLA